MERDALKIRVPVFGKGKLLNLAMKKCRGQKGAIRPQSEPLKKQRLYLQMYTETEILPVRAIAPMPWKAAVSKPSRQSVVQ